MFSIIRRSIPQIYMKIEECIQVTSRSNVIATSTSWNVPYLNGYNLQSFRHKSKKSQKPPTKTESETETSSEPDPMDKHAKIMQATVPSLRADLLLKAGLGLARNKVETLFYDSKLRINGQKLLKKSGVVHEGDEIDVVKGPAGENADLLSVARVEIVSISEKGDGYIVKIRRSRELTIENYDNKTV